MTRFRLPLYVFACALGLSVGCSGPDASDTPQAIFIHVSDPHLFHQQKADEKDGGAKREAQARIDQDGFRSFLRAVGSLDLPVRPEFILITGDIGIEPEQTGVADRVNLYTKNWPVRVATTATLLAESPLSDIYWVAGNNDIEEESADTAALGRAEEFTKEVSAKLPGRVRFQSLTSCFTAHAGTCAADIAGTNYTLLGVTTVSMKNGSEKRGADSTKKHNTPDQEKQLARAETLVTVQTARGRRVIVATHIPELDDPFTAGNQRFGGLTKKRTTLPASAWDVSQATLDSWNRIVANQGVAAVLAGHFHDSHKEIYQRPYSWSESSPLRANISKLFVVPPLSVKVQENSPIQARGFAVISLYRDSVNRRLYWMDPATLQFAPEPVPSTTENGGGGGNWITRSITWAWKLADPATPMAKAVVWSFAFLVAFLAVIALWQIPPTPQEDSPVKTPAPTGSSTSTGVFDGNFGRVAASGLGGMVAIAFLDSYWDKLGFDARPYYVVLFISFFFVGLLLFALTRGFVEAWRSQSLARRLPPPVPIHFDGWRKLAFYVELFLTKLVQWVLSWFRQPGLVFLDTLLSFLVGRNQSPAASAVWERKVVEIQNTIVGAADHVRETLTIAIIDALNAATDELSPDAIRGVRVGVTALSDDGLELFYIASAPGSLRRPFPKQSLAWISVQLGKIMWWVDQPFKDDAKEIVVVRASDQVETGMRQELTMGDCFLAREGSDYEAFIVIPLPLSRVASATRPGAIHISFAKREWLLSLWPDLTVEDWHSKQESGKTIFDEPTRAFGPNAPPDSGLRNSLRLAIGVLSNLLSQFDQDIFDRAQAKRGQSKSPDPFTAPREKPKTPK